MPWLSHFVWQLASTFRCATSTLAGINPELLEHGTTAIKSRTSVNPAIRLDRELINLQQIIEKMTNSRKP
jgi:hypothetical protein